nr:CDP-glucose 4,6-dehydratase [Echinimonas agarilytica]
MSFWQNRRVFITGHTGFKGAWLSQWLLQMGAQVHGYALPPESSNSLFSILQLETRMNHILGDIRDSEGLTKALVEAKADVVFHLAAQPLVIDGYKFPVDTFDVNTMGTVHLLEAVRQCKSVRSVVVITTDKVYEPSTLGTPHMESDPLGGYDPYSASKACTELVVQSYRRSFFNEHGRVGIATARAGNVIGGGDFAEHRLIPDICKAWSQAKPLVIRQPRAVRPWQHVLDALHGYLLLAQQMFHTPQISALAWNFGPAQADMWPVEAIVKHMQEQWQLRTKQEVSVQIEAAVYHENPSLLLDSHKAHTNLDWQPVWSLSTALDYSLQWYLAWANSADLMAVTESQINTFMQGVVTDATRL